MIVFAAIAEKPIATLIRPPVFTNGAYYLLQHKSERQLTKAENILNATHPGFDVFIMRKKPTFIDL